MGAANRARPIGEHGFMEATMFEIKQNTACWYRPNHNYTWKDGLFQGWSVDYEEFDTAPGMFGAAIVVDSRTGETHLVHATDVHFVGADPDAEEKTNGE